MTATTPPLKIPFTLTELPNGLVVILHEDHRLPLVAVNLWYDVGSRDEPPGRSGFAHLFEHLMFMGTERVPYPEFDAIMERAGGWNNASTSEDRTNYYDVGPRDLLPTLLRLEADRMQSLGDSMTAEKLETQRGVVRNERRQSYENRPYGKIHLEIPHRLYPVEHPYREPVIGSHEDLERATLEDVREFFRRFYSPRNSSLAISGDFDPGEALRLVEEHFGGLPRGETVPRRPVPHLSALEEPVRITLTDRVELPLTLSVWRSPPAYADGDAEVDILAGVLGGGKSGRLYRELVYQEQLAQEVAVYQDSRLLGSELQVYVYGRPGIPLEKLEEETDRVIEGVLRDGPREREIERVRNRIETAFWDRLQTLHERADLLNGYRFYYGDPGAIVRDRARYEKVTSRSACEWARAVMQPASRLRVRVLPEDGGR